MQLSRFRGLSCLNQYHHLQSLSVLFRSYSKFFATVLHLNIRIFLLLKKIGFILAIYILALNFAPCEDNNETIDVATVSVEAVDLDNNHEHSDLDLWPGDL